MQINPGGRLETDDVIGRDREIARYWNVLERQGLVISAERRIGKTHIVLKMRDECRDGYLALYQDLEAVHSIADLVRSIYGAIQQSAGTTPHVKAFVAKWSSLVPKIPGVEMAAGDGAWQTLLSDAFDDLIRAAAGRRVLMLWDEFPLMLHNLRQRHGPDPAIHLLDHLRALRLARADRLRFLFTGSIGLRLVLRSLREAGHANDPVNDMQSLTVPPMARSDTCALAEALLAETSAVPSRIPGLATRIADQVGGFPYYIHHVVDQLDQLRRPPDRGDVASTVDHLVHDSHDPANFHYYVSRLSSYYSDADRSLALTVLDVIACQASPATVPEILNLCRHRNPSLSDEQVRQVLTVLAEDHYIERARGGGGLTYDFRWQLVKKWWKEARS